jgi:hypothetical protein
LYLQGAGVSNSPGNCRYFVMFLSLFCYFCSTCLVHCAPLFVVLPLSVQGNQGPALPAPGSVRRRPLAMHERRAAFPAFVLGHGDTVCTKSPTCRLVTTAVLAEYPPQGTFAEYTIQYNTIQFNTIQYNTIQYKTIQFNTTQYNTTQYKYNTIQYNTIKYNTTQYNTIYNKSLYFRGV